MDWAYMLKLGTNMWCDVVPPKWAHYAADELHYKGAADHLRCDDALWREVTDKARAVGFNMLLMDLGEGIQYPSHPELAVKGSWSPDKLRAELARLRGMGLEPVPKLNFSTSHDTWLGEYGRMVSTTEYYRVCADLIRDVADLFGHPRLLHIGYDEESAGQQSHYSYAVVRQGELWWHDLLWFVKTVESAGMRPWMWSDACWKHWDEFARRMPRSVMQSNWYYGDFTNSSVSADSFEKLDKAGFEQMPTGSNWDKIENFPLLVRHCREKVSAERLKGFVMAPWRHTVQHFRQSLISAVDIAAGAIKESGH